MKNLKSISLPVAQLKSSAKDTVMRRTSHAKGSKRKAKQSKTFRITMIKQFKKCSDFFFFFFKTPPKVTSDVFNIHSFYHGKSWNVRVHNLKYFFVNLGPTGKVLKNLNQTPSRSTKRLVFTKMLVPLQSTRNSFEIN